MVFDPKSSGIEKLLNMCMTVKPKTEDTVDSLFEGGINAKKR